MRRQRLMPRWSNPMPEFAYRDLVVRTAATYRLDPTLLQAQVLVESSGDPSAFRYEREYFYRYLKSNPDAKGFKYGPLAACSYGLLQIMLETALEIGFDDPPERLFVPQIGLAWGAKYLRSLVEWAHGDIEQALAAYNGGKAGNGVRPFRTMAYVEKVQLRASQLA